MLKVFELYNDKVCIGEMRIDREKDIWEYIDSKENMDVDRPIFYDAAVLMKRDITSESIKYWVLGRAPEENYEFINYWIERLGLAEYDAYAFFLYNKGAFITDRFHVVEK
jgi:hypothetical protein